MKRALPLANFTLDRDGFEVREQLLNSHQIEECRIEAERLTQIAQSICVRNIREKSKLYRNLSTSPALLKLLPNNYIPVRSILFDKTPEKNWPVAWHQDLTIAVKERQDVDGYGPWSIKDDTIHVQPPAEFLAQMITIRLHLDDTPSTNGALRVIPNSSSLGKISTDKIQNLLQSNEIVCECSAGDALLMSPLILHSSRRSERPNKRRILHFEYAPKNLLPPILSWSETEQPHS